MSLESSEVRVFGEGHVYTGAVGTAFPANIGTTIDSTLWLDLGYLSTDGPKFSFGRETKDIEVWQSFDPVRTIVTKVPKTAKFTLMQTNLHTLELALGGGTVTEQVSGKYKYTPPSSGDVDERAIIIEGVDDIYTYRFCFSRGQVASAVEFSFVREDAVKYDIEMKFLQPDTGNAYEIYTNDANFSWAGAPS